MLNKLGGGDDCLLFRRSDLLDPMQSPVFAALERHDDKLLHSLGCFVRAQLSCSVERIPYLELPVPESVAHLEAIPDAVSTFRDGPRLVHGNVADWVQESNLVALSKSEEARSHVVGDRAFMVHPQDVRVKKSDASPWIRPVASTRSATSLDDAKAQSSPQASLLIPPELACNAPRRVALAKSSRDMSLQLEAHLLRMFLTSLPPPLTGLKSE